MMGSRPVHLRRSDGFGLVELVIAAMVLNIGVLAVISAFQAGRRTIDRAGRETTAQAIASGQIGAYEVLPYLREIMLDPSRGAPQDALYRQAPELQDPRNLKQPPSGTCERVGPGGLCLFAKGCHSGDPIACTPVQPSVLGSDGFGYRVDSYVVVRKTRRGTAKLVAVVVRDALRPGVVYARASRQF